MRLRDVSKILYHNTKRRAVDRKVKLEREESDLETDWKEDVEAPKASKYLLILAVITFLFFLAAVGIASFVRIAGIDRTVSTSKITIVTQGEKVVEGVQRFRLPYASRTEIPYLYGM